MCRPVIYGAVQYDFFSCGFALIKGLTHHDWASAGSVACVGVELLEEGLQVLVPFPDQCLELCQMGILFAEFFGETTKDAEVEFFSGFVGGEIVPGFEIFPELGQE